ncbi:glycosyltransferase involved in cell wall biosynthesis [Variovorax boronicumulans]|uniref:hypothetical protein n=1 Tax=Variovorax boronicumulans TaxID=436515 RepID=UPI0027891A9E|nr:hypothetical protein [Variovorax boronicumulans]MDQ0072564.1 glycosyltransferase involved in cell wall biosynthesis [Variovorax boronicumulans]
MNLMEAQFPKVLVVSAAPINRVDATGITMSNLFAGWPIDRIAQIYDSPIAPDPVYCAKSWRFSSNDIGSVRLAKSAAKRIRALRNPQGNSSGEEKNQPRNSSNDLGLLAVVGDVVPFKAPPALCEWAADFEPDIIYTLLGGSRICELVLQLSKNLDKPIVPHFMDDWPSTIYESHRFRKIFRSVMSRRLEGVLRRAPIGLAIGSGMAEVMSARYAKKFAYFMNCVECVREGAIIKANASNTVRFGYVGGLHLNRWRSLLALAETIQLLALSGTPISLEICAPMKDIELYGSKFSAFSSILHLTSVSPDQVIDALISYDVLVHAESFLSEDSRYTKLSVSTKIPQYMASARPILAIGPDGLSSIQYVEQSRAGLIVTEEGANTALAEAVHRLAQSKDLRDKLGQAGYSTALEHHDASSERLRFASVLSCAASHVIV